VAINRKKFVFALTAACALTAPTTALAANADEDLRRAGLDAAARLVDASTVRAGTRSQ